MLGRTPAGLSSVPTFHTSTGDARGSPFWVTAARTSESAGRRPVNTRGRRPACAAWPKLVARHCAALHYPPADASARRNRSHSPVNGGARGRLYTHRRQVPPAARHGGARHPPELRPPRHAAVGRREALSLRRSFPRRGGSFLSPLPPAGLALPFCAAPSPCLPVWAPLPARRAPPCGGLFAARTFAPGGAPDIRWGRALPRPARMRGRTAKPRPKRLRRGHKQARGQTQGRRAAAPARPALFCSHGCRHGNAGGVPGSKRAGSLHRQGPLATTRRPSECPSRARRALLSWNPGVKNHSLYFRIVVPRNAAAPPPNGRRWMGREPSALGKRGPFGRVCRRFVKSRTLQINMRHERIARIPPERLASGAADDRGAGAGAPPRACRVFYAAWPGAVQAGAPPRR